MGPGIRPHLASLPASTNNNLAHLICPAAVSPQPSWRHPVAGLDSPRTRRRPSGVTRTRWAPAARLWEAPPSAVHAQSAPPPLSVATLRPGCFPRALPESSCSQGRSQTAPPLVPGFTYQLTCRTSPQYQGDRSAHVPSCWQWVSSVLRAESLNWRAVS